MARVSRIFIDNACYHLIVRGNRKQHIFHSPEDYSKYLQILKKAKRKYNISVFAYCLMPNHVHLLTETPTAKNISYFMHWLNRGYTAYFNTKNEKVGHLWQGRFRSKPIVKGQYLINVSTYIENNPVRSGLVNDPAEYSWSSYKERCLFIENRIIDPLLFDCSMEN